MSYILNLRRLRMIVATDERVEKIKEKTTGHKKVCISVCLATKADRTNLNLMMVLAGAKCKVTLMACSIQWIGHKT